MSTSGNNVAGRGSGKRAFLRAYLIAPVIPFAWIAAPAAAYGWAGVLIAALVLWGTVGLAGLPLLALMRRLRRTALVDYLAAAAVVALLDTLLLSLASAEKLATFVDFFPVVFPPMLVGGLLFWFLVERRGRARPGDPDTG